MKNEYTNAELKEIASQLSCPSGNFGMKIADNMYNTNSNLIERTIDELKLSEKYNVLEIGHGNACHLNYLFSKVNELEYYGLEISELMKLEAERLNHKLVKNKKATFNLYDGRNIPFNSNKFDRIFTVNTIYFWKNPNKYLNEIYRVLKNDGRLIISIIKKESMQKLPFTKFDFKMYDVEEICNLLIKTQLKIKKVVEKTENVISNTGKEVTREFSIIISEK